MFRKDGILLSCALIVSAAFDEQRDQGVRVLLILTERSPGGSEAREASGG